MKPTPFWSPREDPPPGSERATAWLSVDGQILAATDEWLAAVGRKREDALGRRVTQLLPESGWALGWGVVPGDGSFRGRPIRHSVVRDASGEVVGVVQELGDSEDEATRLRAELARTRAALEAAERRLDLVPKVAHDLNNVLTALMTQADTEGGAAIAASVQHAAELVSRLTDSPHRPRKIRVDGALLSMHHTLQGIGGSRVRVRLDLHAPDAQVLAIPSELVQVVVNLVTNAVAAMPDGGTVVVSTREHDAAGLPASRRSITVRVVDDGPGMTEDVRRRLFEPFFTTKKDGAGGLGLSIVGDIVRRWKGTVKVVSRPSLGTCVDVILPLEP